MMNIAMIAHGMGPIPPKDWGAVEGIIWQYQQHLQRLGHAVHVYNTPLIHHVLHDINTGDFDFVHCHNELFAAHCHAHLRQPYVITTHNGGIFQYEPGSDRYPELAYPLADCLKAPGCFAVDAKTVSLFERQGYTGFLRMIPGAVECDAFHVGARGNGKAICLGFVEPRKRQAWLARAAAGRVAIDFVGPWDRQRTELLEERDTIRYLGVWDRPTLYRRLTEYSCLVLLSESEAGTPRVVLEALAAGVSVVISDACLGCLDPRPFIRVLPHDRLDADGVVAALQGAIAGNDRWRGEIRAYAANAWDYSVMVRRYLDAVQEFRRVAPAPTRP